MISYLRGEVIDRGDNSVIIDVGGVGYEVFVPYRVLCTLERNRGTAELYTYLQVLEDRFTLYGFLNKQDLKTFKLLITVSGIGPKGALAIMSAMTTEDLILAVISDDCKTISRTPGIGAKTAAKLVLELKDKFSLQDTLTGGDDGTPLKGAPTAPAAGSGAEEIRSETVQALTALGYTASEALKAVRSVDITPDMTSEQLLKQSLKFI